MRELIAIGISMPDSPNIKIEIMPTKEVCYEVLERFQFKSSMNDSGESFVYCRPKSKDVN